MIGSRRDGRFVATIALAAVVAAWPAPAAAVQQGAGCAAQLEWAADWASRNYSGYDDKVGARGAGYTALIDSLRVDAAGAATDAACDLVIRRWIAFFQDRHLSFGRPRAPSASVASQAGSADEIRARFAAWERLDIDEARVRDMAIDGADPLTGIWESSDGSYRVAVIPGASPESFVMTVLRADSVWWMPGQVKAHLVNDGDLYRTRFFMRDHSEQAWTGAIRGNVLRFQNGSTWIRDWPRAAGELSPGEFRQTLNMRFDARELAPGTVLVNVPTFGDPRAIDSLFTVKGRLIRRAERLVIDLRGNGGGSDYNFRMLTPLLYTGPVRLLGNMVLVTEDNIRANEAMIADTAFPAGQRRQMKSSLDQVRRAGKRWYVYDDQLRRERTVLSKPRSVAIITDGGCASSCEGFLFVALQSAKTRIYGSNTAGIADYGNVRRADMPGTTLTLYHPTTRTRRIDIGQGIDNKGIEPHVRIPADVVDQVSWVLERMD